MWTQQGGALFALTLLAIALLALIAQYVLVVLQDTLSAIHSAGSVHPKLPIAGPA